MRSCPACHGGGAKSCPEHGLTECPECSGDGVDKTTRRNRITYAMELMNPYRQPGYGLTAGDVWESIRKHAEEPAGGER